MNLFKNNICVRSHLGMGDTIITCGLIRHLAKDHDLVVVLSKPSNVESTAYLFRDLPNVVVRYVLDDEGADLFFEEVWKGKKLRLGIGGYHGFDNEFFDQEFYRQAGLSFDLRWSGFHLERAVEQEVNINAFATGEPFVFVHQDIARGMQIDVNKLANTDSIFKNGRYNCDVAAPAKGYSNNLFAWIPLIENAKECHCINSSFALLIDSLPRRDQKLYLHKYARGSEMPTFRHDWIVLE